MFQAMFPGSKVGKIKTKNSDRMELPFKTILKIVIFL